MTTPSLYKIVAYARWHRGEVSLDMCATARWPKGFTDKGLTFAATIAELGRDDFLKAHGFEEAVDLCNIYPKMQMRSRFNTDVEGPFVFDSDTPLDDDTILDLIRSRLEN